MKYEIWLMYYRVSTNRACKSWNFIDVSGKFLYEMHSFDLDVCISHAVYRY